MHYKNYSPRYNNYSYMRRLGHTTANVYILILFILFFRIPLPPSLPLPSIFTAFSPPSQPPAARAHNRALPSVSLAPSSPAATHRHSLAHEHLLVHALRACDLVEAWEGVLDAGRA